jgi:hypothetical protein
VNIPSYPPPLADLQKEYISAMLRLKFKRGAQTSIVYHNRHPKGDKTDLRPTVIIFIGHIKIPMVLCRGKDKERDCVN